MWSVRRCGPRVLPSSHVPAVHTRQMALYGYEQAKALTFSEHGEPSSVLNLHSHSISPAHGNLLTLKFLASPINPADINQLQGVYPSKPIFDTSLGTSNPAAVGGNEGVAQVISKGSHVDNLKIGNWVIMRRPAFGTWRTHAQTTADKVTSIGDHEGITPLQAATVSVNPCTAYRMLKDFATLKPGDWFIQNGANSGVGRAAIQLGSRWGFKSINIIRERSDGSTDALKQELRDLGADIVVTTDEAMDKSFPDHLASLCATHDPIKLGLNCVGGKLVNSMCKVLAPEAHMVTYGAMSRQPTILPTSLLIFQNITFHGFWVSRWSEKYPVEKMDMVKDVLDMIRKGEFRDTPFDVVPWRPETKQEELIEAVQGTLDGYRAGKGVFVFEGT